MTYDFTSFQRGWSGGARVLGKPPVPGRPTNLDKSRARAYCTCSRCGWGLFGHFSLVYHFSFLSPSLWETARYRLKYWLKGPLSPNQPTNVLSIVFQLCQDNERMIMKGCVQWNPVYGAKEFASSEDRTRDR